MGRITVAWTDDLLTGDPEIDESHRTLFGKAVQLGGACAAGKGALELDTALAFLYDYAIDHFATEEAKMVAIDYPYLATHIASHRAYHNRLEELRQQAARTGDREAAARACADFVADWFNRHVKLVDRPFIEYLRGDRR